MILSNMTNAFPLSYTIERTNVVLILIFIFFFQVQPLFFIVDLNVLLGLSTSLVQ